jgi:MFS family permease
MSRLSRVNPIYLLHAVTIFLGAFLVFQIQPMISKAMLPYFGGSSSVWATSLLFFSTALSLGYFYVWVTSHFSIAVQVRVHVAALVASAAYVFVSLTTRSTLAIDLNEASSSNAAPAVIVLFVLAASVGIPYVVLSSTSPLVQHWYGLSHNKEPYKLYAISNAGSFLALLSYPFIVEPLWTLTQQQEIWGWAFLAFTLLCTSVSIYTYKKGTSEDATPPEKSMRPWMKWFLYSAFPGFLLVATTAAMTQKIAPVPLLWIIPLSIYLASFVFAYSGFGSGPITTLAFIGATAFALNQNASPSGSISIIASACALLFTAALFCHAKVYALRPHSSHSPLFYLITSLGGAFGTLTASILPPLIFNDVEEMNIAIAISATLCATALYMTAKEKDVRFVRPTYITSIVIILVLCVIAIIPTQNSLVVYQERTFYGVNTVKEDDSSRALFNNSVVHGFQFKDKQREFEPALYYPEISGIGQAINFARSDRDTLRVGVLGLGSGTLAAYCRPQDRFTFYEIDDNMAKIARDNFTYLNNCQNNKVLIGDGRVIMENRAIDSIEEFDVLAVDAFTGGSIPSHLLTREALALYSSQMRSDRSIIVFHVTNAYLNLEGVVHDLAQDAGYTTRTVKVKEDRDNYRFESKWVVLAKDDTVFDSPEFTNIQETQGDSGTLWTDESTNILSVLKF